MSESKRLILVMALVLFATVLFGGNTPSAGEGQSSILKKAEKLKRVVKRELMPYRGVAGVLKTGQSTSYAAGDDGDLQRGIRWPEPRFVDHGDGTVTDKVTGLMWTKDAQRLLRKVNWYDALKACNDLVLAGHDNWRLPNVREMVSLIDYGAYDPALPSGHPFTNIQLSDPYWSSTTSVPHVAQAWSVGMVNGSVRRYNKTSNTYHIWPVRRGRHRIW